MFRDFKETFKDDYIYLRKVRIRPFSLAWWMIRIGQCVCGLAFAYIFYVLLWVLCG